MTERLATTPAAPSADGSSLPARLRIVGWIVLATALGLAAVVVTLRSTLSADIERAANEEVVQEVDEFRTFTQRGRDPETGQAFATAGRLLQLHLERQFPGGSQVLVGVDRSGATAPLVQGDVDRLDVQDPVALLDRLAARPDSAGAFRDDQGDLVRWGKVQVQPDGVFLVLQTTGAALAEVDRIVRLVLLVSLLGLVATAGIAWAVAGQILAPVRAVRLAASRITRADLDRRIEVRGRDDVAALAHVFNAMLDRLQDAFGTQQRLSAAATTHLRGPLQVLAARAGDDAEVQQAVHEVDRVLADLAVLAAAEAPGFVQPAPVDVARLTADVADRARRLPGATVVVVEVADVVALLDADRVTAAALALVRNAVEASPPGRPVQLATRVVDDAVELSVRDDGPGLPADAAARVLERFGDGASTGSGPGLGLAVVRAVADGHDGSAWVETEPGAGAVFGLLLPLHPAVAEARPQEDDDPSARHSGVAVVPA